MREDPIAKLQRLGYNVTPAGRNDYYVDGRCLSYQEVCSLAGYTSSTADVDLARAWERSGSK